MSWVCCVNYNGWPALMGSGRLSPLPDRVIFLTVICLAYLAADVCSHVLF